MDEICFHILNIKFELSDPILVKLEWLIAITVSISSEYFRYSTIAIKDYINISRYFFGMVWAQFLAQLQKMWFGNPKIELPGVIFFAVFGYQSRLKYEHYLNCVLVGCFSGEKSALKVSNELNTITTMRLQQSLLETHFDGEKNCFSSVDVPETDFYFKFTIVGYVTF